MARADLNDRRSVESVYSFDDYGRDSARNEDVANPVRHGVRVASAPDPDGCFELTVAAQQAGERDPEGDSVFLAPYRTEPPAGEPSASPEGLRRHAYDTFIDGVIETARTAAFKPPVGRDARLKGFHGG